MRSESYSFIWHPNVRMKSFLGKAAQDPGAAVIPWGPSRWEGRNSSTRAEPPGLRSDLRRAGDRERYLATRGPTTLARSTTICLACAAFFAPATATRSCTSGLSKSAVSAPLSGRVLTKIASLPTPGTVSTFWDGLHLLHHGFPARAPCWRPPAAPGRR